MVLVALLMEGVMAELEMQEKLGGVTAAEPVGVGLYKMAEN